MEVKREWFEKDYYAVLGVSPDATEKHIQKRIENWPETSIRIKTLEIPKLKNDSKTCQLLTM